MLNVAVIMGRLVADPELKHTTTNRAVTSFRVAVDRSYQKPGTERQADFIDVVAWEKRAEFVCRYFKKGSMIAVRGSIQTRSYTDNNGIKRYPVEINADEISFTGSKQETGTTGNDYGLPPATPEQNMNTFSEPTPAYSSGSNEDFEEVIGDDDLPF